MEQLGNLVRIRELQKEPADPVEFGGLLQSARDRIQDINQYALSKSGQFDLAYNAAHSLALGALRCHGYRSTNRYQVFQCLVHTAGLSSEKMQVFAQCHHVRNVAEYEGHLELGETMLGGVC